MKNKLALLIAVIFFSSVGLVAAKDYQVTGPVVDVKDDVIVVKKGADNWELARDKDTKATGEFKKGDKVTIKYKMIATSIEGKEAPKAKAETKTKADDKMKGDAKAKTK
ncbi:MAG: hypothetical protein EXR70_04045 [Deltaproteobacteria bacterium]|nr:hypothetical protein [Deltaproteobacteria bacterium]